MTYWHAVANHYGLTLSETDTLTAYAETDAARADIDAGASSRQIIADALRPAMLDARAASDAADSALSRMVGADIGHGILTGGVPTVTLYASTADYMLTCVSTGERVGYRVNRDAYATPADIPASMRKARTLVSAFQTAHDDGAIRAAIAFYVAADDVCRRWSTFDRAE